MDKEVFLTAAKKFGTPLYLYDLKEIEKRFEMVENTLLGVNHKVFFAFKANSNPYLVDFLRALGLGADVVSLNEYKLALSVGFRTSEIVVNGNGKTTDELKTYAESKVGCINVDSLEEIRRFPNLSARIAIRINPNVDAKTHPHISTGLKKNKFGVDIQTASRMIRNLPSNLKLVGLHCHIGSQITNISPFMDAFRSLKDFIEEENLNLEFINIGGGWGIDYEHNGKGLNVRNYREKVVPMLRNFGVPVHLELGRFIIGPAGYLVTQVKEVKTTALKNFVVVDASMSDLIRPSLYNAYHHIKFLSNDSQIVADVVGRLCESGDILAKDRKISKPKTGDLGVVYDVGAYGYTMSSNYNLSLRPPEVAFDGEKLKLIRRRETLEDVVRLCKYPEN